MTIYLHSDVYLDISLLKILYIHHMRIYMILAIPMLRA
jgi:hypothetical protein